MMIAERVYANILIDNLIEYLDENYLKYKIIIYEYLKGESKFYS